METSFLKQLSRKVYSKKEIIAKGFGDYDSRIIKAKIF